MGKGAKFGAASVLQKHLNYSGLYAHKGADVFWQKKLDCFQFKGDVADDGSITMPFSIDYAAWGWITIGTASAINDYSMFFINGVGNVVLISASGNVVANADTDAKLCVGTAGSQEPLVIKNRLGASKHITLMIFYD